MKLYLILTVTLLAIGFSSCKKDKDIIETYDYFYIDGVKYGFDRNNHISELSEYMQYNLEMFFDFKSINTDDIVYKDFLESILHKKLFYRKDYNHLDYRYSLRFRRNEYICGAYYRECVVTDLFGQTYYNDTIVERTQYYAVIPLDREDSYFILDKYKKVLEYKPDGSSKTRYVYLIEGRYNIRAFISVHDEYSKECVFENGRFKLLLTDL